MAENVVPPIERAAIIAEAKQETVNELVKRSKTISQLPKTTEFIGKDIELSTGESIPVDEIVSQITNNSNPTWEDE